VGGVLAAAYHQWIGHIVKKGYIVVWVQYQHDDIGENMILTFPWLYPRKIITMWKDALERLDREGALIRPERDENGKIKTAFVGHSAGGYLSMVIAGKVARKREPAPEPYAVVAIEPGGLALFTRAPFRKIDPDTKFVIVVGDEDDVNCVSPAVRLWEKISHIPDDNKDFLMVQSDYHGAPEQIANHYFPVTSGQRDTAAVDARDYYVTFKLSVAALDCAFRDIDCEYALGNGGQEQVSMGEWSDGQPVSPMVWTEDPRSLEPTCDNASRWN